jgi:DNA-binding response OmpR family regulator
MVTNAFKPDTGPAHAAPYPVPSGVILIATEGQEHVAERLRELSTMYGWSHTFVADHDRLAWSATVHRPEAVLLVSNSEKWTSWAVSTVRGATNCALVVVGTYSSPSTVALIRSGVDAVIAPQRPGEELLARVFAVIRRVREVVEPGTRYLVADELRLDLWKRSVTKAGTEIPMTTTEFNLLAHLMSNSGQALSTRSIIAKVWGSADIDGLNTLRLFVGRLRQKLGDDAAKPRFIKSLRGHGYSFGVEVLELADESRTRRAPESQDEGLLAVEYFGEAISGCLTEESIAQTFVQKMIDGEAAVAAAVHHLDGGALVLLAHQGMSEAWVKTAGGQVPLGSGFASADALLSKSPLLVKDLPSKRYRATSRAIGNELPGSYLFLPAKINGSYEALIGVVRRSDEPYTPSVMRYLRAAAATYGAIVTACRAGRTAQLPSA